MKPDGNVTLTITRGLKRVTLESRVVKGLKEGLLIDCILKDDRIIGFPVNSLLIINAFVVDVDTNKLYVWKSIKVDAVLYQGEKYHLLVSNEEGNVVNRRGGYRVYLGPNGIAQLGMNTCAYKVIVKDISYSGIAIIFKDDIEIKSSDIIHVTFTDKKLNRKFNINAHLVRKEQLKNGNFLYGCTILGKHSELRKYINEKQIDKNKYIRLKKNYM